jgi:nitrate/TMAO reductase-like tetraheme cytochrome c subunit
MLKTSLRWIGVVFALCSALYCFYSQPQEVTISVFFSLGVIYLVVVLLSKERFNLYFAASFLALAYLLLIERAVNPNFYALAGVLPFLVMSLLSLVMEGKNREFSQPLNIVGHAVAVSWLTYVVFSLNAITNLPLVFLSFSLYLATDLFWYRWKGNRWHLLPLVLFYALFCALLPYGLSLSAALYYLLALIVYGQIAFFIARSQWQEGMQPVYSGAVIVALGGMILSFLGEMGWIENLVLVLCSAIFILTIRAFKRWEFIYLMILCLGLLADNFLKVANDPLYGHMVDYIRQGLVVLGLIFLYPFVRGVFKINWSLSSFLIATRARTFFIFFPILLFILYALFDYTMVVTENPYFCGSCHAMNAPFKSWKRDVHYEENIGCFDCHYTPGLSNFFRGRIYGLLMVIKYFTGYYPPKSSANVNDASCLRAGCHTKDSSDLYQAIVSNQFQNSTIKFNHEVMLNQKNFGIELKCNNCHEHVSDTEGVHFAISEEVCYYCHLMNPKDKSIGTAIGTCFTCHDTAVEQLEEASFVLVGDGAVTQEGCLDCHYEVKQFDDTQYQHDVHINENTDFTKTKVECGGCHGEILHGRFEG